MPCAGTVDEYYIVKQHETTGTVADRAVRGRIFSVLFLAIFTAMLGLGIIIPILPVYARSESIGASGLWLGAIFAGFSISRSVFMPLIGRSSDRTGMRKAFIATGLFLYAVSSLGYIFAFNAASLLCVRVIQGFCSAMIVPIAMAYIGEICPKDKEATYMGIFTISLFMGFSVGPFLGGCIQDFYSVNAAFVVMGLLCVTAFFFVVCMLPPSPGKQSIDRQAPSSYSSILKSRQIRGIVCYRFVNAFARASVLTFLPLYASYRLELTGTQIGIIISAGVLLSSFLQYPFGRLADAVDRRYLIIIGNILYAAAIAFFPYAFSFAQLLGLNLLLGVLGAAPLPAATALIVEEGKQFGMGSTMAVFNVAMSLGLGMGPLVTGVVHDVVGVKAVFFFAAGIGVLGTLVSGHLLSASPPPSAPAEHTIVEDI